MIYVTGAVNGNQCLWETCVAPMLKEGDTVICTGDFGIGSFNGCPMTEKQFFDYLSKKKYTILFVDGEKENYRKLRRHCVSRWNGGWVHRIRPNIIHLMRGEVYEIEGKRLFAFGGAASVETPFRVPGKNWWSEELPSKREYANAYRNLRRCNYRVDYIITHTCPKRTLNCMPLWRTATTEELPLMDFFDELRMMVRYKRWYFGHFCEDKEMGDNQYALLHDIRELDTGRWVVYRI